MVDVCRGTKQCAPMQIGSISHPFHIKIRKDCEETPTVRTCQFTSAELDSITTCSHVTHLGTNFGGRRCRIAKLVGWDDGEQRWP
eukprot:scaffold49342_cov34-Prasinocladus_malaysianus.AAC.1